MTITVTDVHTTRPRQRRLVEVGSTSADDESFKTAHTMTSYKTSSENPKWRQQVRNHQNATTGRQIVDCRVEGGYGSVVQRWKRLFNGRLVNQWSELHGDIFYPTTTMAIPAVNAAADNQARMRFFKRAKSAQTAFRSLTALGELAETLHMLRNPGKALRTGLDDYLRNVMKRSRRAKKTSLNRIVSETWLEHVFGWQPLLSDIKSAGEGLNRRLNRFQGSYTRVSGLGVFEDTDFASSLTLVTETYLRYRYRIVDLTQVSVRYYGEVRSVCENPIQADMTLFGFDWTEIIPTAWELIPYSFLADYFSNIGDVLDAWSVRKSDVCWMAKSIRRRKRRTLSEIAIDKAYLEANTPVASWVDRYIDTSYYKNSSTQIDRSTATPTLPSVALEIPGLGTKWINISALLLARNRTRRQLFS